MVLTLFYKPPVSTDVVADSIRHLHSVINKTYKFQHAVLSPYKELEKGDEGVRVVVTTIVSTSADCPDVRTVSKGREVAEAEQKFGFEAVFERKNIYDSHRAPGLAVFDMDSTLIQQEVIDELAAAVGVKDKVSAITKRAMEGEIDFTESLKLRVALLEGVPTTVWDELKESTIKFTPGARDLTKCLKQLGWKMAVLSGGFTPLASWVAHELKLDYYHANKLCISEDGAHLTGKLEPDSDIIHAERKQALLLRIAAGDCIPLERVVAVGDGANDLPMLGTAGLGIAFDAKPKVQMEAPARLNTRNLLDVMYLLGYDKKAIDGLLLEP
ncbi:hypothetical protein B0A49_01431 [Cryomyces minteri]|uniref:phosphoserine phosphatase n=1 Tax=Cryomyces minteri TaxID=331657 RepID=A0A4U0XRH5_9PEZI|nr:hypothetical protein B0A49_01431 [Cryomyces minteri]